MTLALPLTMPEVPHRRRNPLNGQWVLVSPQRALRPWQGAAEPADAAPRSPHDAQCHLCPGNARANGQVNPVYRGPWVFANDFSALLPAPVEGASTAADGDDLLQAQPVAGDCRVVCYSPDHAATLAELDLPAVRAVVQTWCDETAALGRQWRWVQVFENKGEAMGCSSPHPHGQIWAGDFLPHEPALEDAHQAAYHQRHARPLLLDLARREEADGQRVVLRTDHWLVVVPWWATWPFETLLLPRFAVQRLPQLTAAQRDDLALALQGLTVRYDNLFGCAFPYSMGWHGAPFAGAASRVADPASDLPHWQLHAHFYPPLLRSARVRKFMVGYEMLAEAQRDLTPEQAAQRLRALPAAHYRQRQA